MFQERRQSGKWLGLLVFLFGILFLLADFSEQFNMFGISGWSVFFSLTGLLLLSKESPLQSRDGGINRYD